MRRLALDGTTNDIDADARGVSTLAPHPSSGDACAVASSRVRLVKGTERRTLPGAHATFVRCLAWTKDGRRVASSADAREILVHDCVSNSSETLRCAAPLISLACFVRSLRRRVRRFERRPRAARRIGTGFYKDRRRRASCKWRRPGGGARRPAEMLSGKAEDRGRPRGRFSTQGGGARAEGALEEGKNEGPAGPRLREPLGRSIVRGS